MNGTLYLDSSIVLAAAGPAASPHQAASARVLEAIANGDFAAVISSEVLVECLHAAQWRHARRQGLDLISNLQVLFPHPIPCTGAALAEATDLLRRHPRVGIRAGLHAVLAQGTDTTEILSFDADFGLIPGLRRWEPDQVLDGQRSRAR